MIVVLEVGDLIVARKLHPRLGEFPFPNELFIYLGVSIKHDGHVMWSIKHHTPRWINSDWFVCFDVLVPIGDCYA
jgi:hypothetical protein